jgi:hypothetical protein
MSTVLRRALPALALVLVAATPRDAAIDGWKFTWKITAEGTDGKKTERRAPPTMGVSLVPGKARIDYLDGTPQGQKKGTYMVLDADRSEMIMVSPEEKTAMVMDPTMLGSALNAIGQTRLVRMEVSGVKADVEKLGPGERILGHATTKYRITREHVMEMSVLGRKNRTSHRSVTEAWYANDQFIEDRVFDQWAKNFTGNLNGIGGDAFKKLMEAEQNLPKGIVLKQVMHSVDTDDKGKPVETTFTMEMQELQKASLDASLFQVPEGYKVHDMKTQMAELSDSMKVAKAECEKEKGEGNCDMPNLDSAMKAGAKEGAADGAKGAARKALRGLLRKP